MSFRAGSLPPEDPSAREVLTAYGVKVIEAGDLVALDMRPPGGTLGTCLKCSPNQARQLARQLILAAAAADLREREGLH